MSDESELKRLRADLEAMERVQGLWVFSDDFRDEFYMHKDKFSKKIARLEEAEADPWREAKEFCNDYRDDKERFGIVTAYIDHITAENERLQHNAEQLTAEVSRLEKRVAELEKEPEFTPAILMRADEIVIGDVILAGGMIRTVTEFGGDHPNRRIIRCDGWMAWFGNHDLIAVLPQPLVEAKTVADMQPPFDEPILDPARVLATTRMHLNDSKENIHGSISYLMWCHVKESQDAKPYRLKETAK